MNPTQTAVSFDLVVPTIGRPSLARLLTSLAAARGPQPDHIVLVDDRRNPGDALDVAAAGDLAGRVTVVRGKAAGPAAARNRGWRLCNAPWVAFLDDDVTVDPDWFERLASDIAAAHDAAATYGHVRVDLPTHRRLTDWERNVQGLQTARWITADCAYRRSVLAALHGFDERFPRAYREDADLALRAFSSGHTLVTGTRWVTHEVRPVDRWISVRLQAGNADDALMERLHGADWRERAGAARGAFSGHVVTAVLGALAVVTTAGWFYATVRFAWRRIGPGPRTPGEIATMLATSPVIPFAAVYHRGRGSLRARGLARRRVARAVLFDRDGTLVHDTPILGDPARVQLVERAAEAVNRLRSAGIAIGVVSNQAGIAEGAFTLDDLRAVNARIETALGSVDTWSICTHAASERCDCRKPAPGLVHRAAAALGVKPQDCVVIGDIGADVEAATAAGARSVLVPTPITRSEEIAAAPVVAQNVFEAVELVLAGVV